MNNKLKIAFFAFILLAAGVAQAEILKCAGQDSNGTAFNVQFNSDPQNQVLTVNGTTHKIEASTKNHKGVATENYSSDSGVLVYDSFLKKTDTNYFLERFNAMTDEILFTVDLNCNISK